MTLRSGIRHPYHKAIQRQYLQRTTDRTEKENKMRLKPTDIVFLIASCLKATGMGVGCLIAENKIVNPIDNFEFIPSKYV